MLNQSILSIVFPATNLFGVKAISEAITLFNAKFDRLAFRDFELIIVTNQDFEAYSELVSNNANIQMYGVVGNQTILEKLQVGVENAIGDVVLTFDPEHTATDVFDFLQPTGDIPDITYFYSKARTQKGLRSIYYRAFKFLHGLDLTGITSGTRLFSRRAINYLLQCPDFELAWKTLPMQVLLPSKLQSLAQQPLIPNAPFIKKISDSLSLLVCASKSPLQIAGLFCLTGALFNLTYAGYVFGLYLLAIPIAGWTTLSLQQALTNFILCFTLWLFSEHLSHKPQRIPTWIEREQTSNVLSRKSRLNVEEDHA